MKSISPSALPLHARAEFYDHLGSIYQSQGRYAESKKHIEKSIRFYKSQKDYHGAVHLLLRLGDLERQLENFTKATKWYEEAQTLIGRVSKKGNSDLVPLAVDAACGKALCWRGLGQFKKAERWFDDLLAVYRKNKDGEGQAYLHWALGTTQRFLGQLRLAEKNLKKSIQLYKKIKDEDGLAYAHCGLGGTLRMQGRARESGQLYRRANQTFRKVKDQFGEAYSNCGQANALRMQKKFGPAKSYFSKAISLYRKLGQKGPLAFVLWSVAQQELFQEKRKAAQRYLKESERLFRSVQDERGLIYAHLGWGVFYQPVSPSRSSRFFKEAYQLSRKKGLLLEMAHALTRISSYPASALYKRVGVNWPAYRSYQMLP